MHRHEMQQSNIYLGIYIIEYYFFWKNQGVTSAATRLRERKPAPSPARASRRIVDERPRLEGEIPIHLV
jgi:hypothetical protein